MGPEGLLGSRVVGKIYRLVLSLVLVCHFLSLHLLYTDVLSVYVCNVDCQ